MTIVNGLDALSEKIVMDALRDFGLTERESKVYMFLAKSGEQKGGDISRNLKMHKAQVYSILKKLQSRGIVESTLEFPMRFTAIPFEKVLDLFIKAKREETSLLEDREGELLAHWRSISAEKPSPPLEKLAVLSGRTNIYSRILQMIGEAEKEVLAITTKLGIIRADQAGLVEAGILRGIEKSNGKGRVLTYVSKENLEIIKRAIREVSTRHLNIEVRHVDLASESCLRIVIKDGEEVIFFITPQEDTSITAREDTGLWTNNKPIIDAFKTFFERLWSDAVDIDTRIYEVETGKPVEETIIIKDAQMAYEKFREILDAAREEIIGLTSSKGVIRLLENYPVRQYSEKSVNICIMAPIDIDNLESAQSFSKYCQIRHIDAAYMRIMIVDKKHFFQFKVPPLDKETTEPMDSFDNTLYTNDIEYVERMREMLNDMWNRALEISEIKSEAAMRSPPLKVSTSDTASKVIDTMLKNNIGSVLVVEDNKPVGIITEKDVLERVIKAQKETERTYAKEIMSTPVMAIDANRPLIEAVKMMQNNGIRRLAVTKEGNLTGILTERRALRKIRKGFSQATIMPTVNPRMLS